jgi:hypothetical protein
MGQHLFRSKCEAASNYQGDDDYNESTFHELMNEARLVLRSYAEEVLRADQRKLYSDFAFDIETSQWFEESFPETNFFLVLDLIKDPRFLKTKKGWPVILIFEAEWKKITEEQKALLLQALEGVYEKFEDWMPRFSISELVGGNFEPSQALQFFRGFAASPVEGARAFVPHGYEHVLLNSPSVDLKAQVWNALLDMEHDESEKVRGEVEETLYRLSNRGLRAPT